MRNRRIGTQRALLAVAASVLTLGLLVVSASPASAVTYLRDPGSSGTTVNFGPACGVGSPQSILLRVSGSFTPTAHNLSYFVVDNRSSRIVYLYRMHLQNDRDGVVQRWSYIEINPHDSRRFQVGRNLGRGFVIHLDVGVSYPNKCSGTYTRFAFQRGG